MPMVRWEESLETGFRRVDEQHRRLVQIINDVYDALTAEQTANIMAEVVNKLLEYAREHFATEEALMHRYGYPAIAEHRAEHEFFAARARDLDTDCRCGNYAGPAEVLAFLTDWLVRHIKGTDKLTCDYLTRRGAI